MKILAFNNYIYNSYRPSIKNRINISNLKPLENDIVTFSSKKYSIDNISSPTNHCAYCGCKVYSEQQIDSIAKEMLASKSDRLQGKVRSVLEKLYDAKNSKEIAVAKRIENQQQIEFFKNFLDIVSNKPYLKGEAIFSQVYSISRDEALELLVKNMLPLLRTVDHVSPQNQEQENKDSDMNLVEACYCCNHDLKKGVPFSEFYALFPSIKNNMPAEKFNYAHSRMSSNTNSGIFQKFSATNMLKLIDRLFIQRNEAANYLSSVNYRLMQSKPQISELTADLQKEILSKSDEIARLQKTFDSLTSDPEFRAMVNRSSLLSSLHSEKTLLTSLYDKKSRISYSINDIKNDNNSKTSKRTKKQTAPLSPEQLKENQLKLDSLSESLDSVSSDISNHEEKVLAIQSAIEELNKKFPTVEILQIKKKNAEDIYNAHLSYELENSQLQTKYKLLQQLDSDEAELKDKLAQFPDERFSISSLSPEQKQDYERYISLLEADKYIIDHPNGGSIKNIIKQSAKLQIDSELAQLAQKPIIIIYNQDIQRKIIEAQFAKLTAQKENLKSEIDSAIKRIKSLELKISQKSKEEAILNV